jgi:hypothetical protein
MGGYSENEILMQCDLRSSEDDTAYTWYFQKGIG